MKGANGAYLKTFAVVSQIIRISDTLSRCTLSFHVVEFDAMHFGELDVIGSSLLGRICRFDSRTQPNIRPGLHLHPENTDICCQQSTSETKACLFDFPPERWIKKIRGVRRCADPILRLKGCGARRLIKGKKSSKAGALALKGRAPKGKGSLALAEYIKKKRDKQIRRNQRKHREEIIENREEYKQLKKISDIFWSAHLKDEVSRAQRGARDGASAHSVGFTARLPRLAGHHEGPRAGGDGPAPVLGSGVPTVDRPLTVDR